MKKMRLMSLAVAAVLCAGFVSCGDDDDDEPQNPATENTGGASSDGGNGNGNNGSGSNGDNAGGNSGGDNNAGGDNGSDNNGGNAGGTIELVGAVADAVDLGLPSGTLWASWNVGATAPEESGGYYAWGEIEEKEVYDWSTYKWCNGSETSLTKYCTNSYWGTVDNKTELELEDDVAHMMWGNGWCMPTYEQFRELAINCTWSLVTVNDEFLVHMAKSNINGNSIIFPVAGCYYPSGHSNYGYVGKYGCEGYYLGRTLNIYLIKYSLGLELDHIQQNYNSFEATFGLTKHYRHYGCSVRPVKEK